MDELWRLIHLVAAALWLGGLISLGIVSVVGARNLDRAAFGRLMSGVGRAFAFASVAAWTLIALSGAAMAWPRLGRSLVSLRTTNFGHLLLIKSGLAFVAFALAAGHALYRPRARSSGAVAVSRAASLLTLAATVAVYWVAVRLTEG